MITTNTYVLPEYWASALINDDFSGMSREDTEDLNKFIKDNKEKNCRFACIGCSEEPYFKWSNDATKLGGNVLEYTFDVTSITGVKVS